MHLLVLGGSLGAAAINELVPQVLPHLDQGRGIEVWHQTGRTKHESTQRAYQQWTAISDAGSKSRVEPFIDDMAAAYAWADLVLCRAGASTVAELAAAGLPSILVPYPHAVDDHQTGNAHWLVDAGAAVLLPQHNFNQDSLRRVLEEFMAENKRLPAMAQRARALAVPDAAERISELCLEVCRG
jgi:UDP-N-acetylglucosamine--N-acetylmuramyl-(pentapeptide) pyrophosphoryl-undecaprenol N-acetylglucosamine transferase